MTILPGCYCKVSADAAHFPASSLNEVAVLVKTSLIAQPRHQSRSSCSNLTSFAEETFRFAKKDTVLWCPARDLFTS